MATVFQTIPTMDPSESAFVVTVDDNLILPSTLPVTGTRWIDWEVGQKDRTIDPEWNNYVFVDTQQAAPGRRAFIFGKSKSASELDIPFETYFDSEFHRWPAVVVQTLRVMAFIPSNSPGAAFNDRFFVKSATDGNCTVKVEHFQNAFPFDQSKMRHPQPVTEDLILSPTLTIPDCLHSDIKRFADGTLTSQPDPGQSEIKADGLITGLGYTIPATNFVDWAPYVLKDSQKQSNGMWVREKITIYPPINAKRKVV